MIIHINMAYPCSRGDYSHQHLWPIPIPATIAHINVSYQILVPPTIVHVLDAITNYSTITTASFLTQIYVPSPRWWYHLAIHHFIPHLNPNSLRPALLSNIVGVHVTFILDQCHREKIIPRSSPWSPRVGQKTPRYIGPKRSIVVHMSSQIFIQQSQPKGSRRCLQKIVRFCRFG